MNQPNNAVSGQSRPSRPYPETSAGAACLDELKAEKPDLEARQRAARALWWDKHVDRAAWREWRGAEIAQKPYVYQTDVK